MSSKEGHEEGSSVQDFIWKLEASAKRVLKDANKKAREAQIAEQTRTILEGRKAAATAKAKTAKGMLKDGSVKMAHTQLSSSMDLSDVQSMGRLPPGTDTLEMRYSVPKMFVSMAIDNAATANLMDGGLGGKHSPRATSSGPGMGGGGGGGSTGGALSPIKKKGQILHKTLDYEAGTDAAAATTKLSHTAAVAPAAAAPLRRNMVLEALGSSAYISQGTGSLEEIMLDRAQATLKIKQRAQGQGQGGDKESGGPEKETTSALKSHVTAVMSGKQSGATKLHRKLIKDRQVKLAGGAAGRKTEQQGPVDWSTNGLKLKYRGEAEREALFRSWETANAYSMQAMDTQDIVIPIAKIQRHPLFVQFYQHIKAEQNGSTLRTRARLLMKRFVFDVHEVWLTNLQHLREHQPARLMAKSENNHDEEEHGHGHGAELGVAESKDEQGNGLAGRRDHRAIEGMEAQIQSVSLKRSLSKAYYTTHMPEPKTVLNFIPAETPEPLIPRNLPPTMENLVDGLYVKTVDAEHSVDPNNKRVGIPYIAIFVDRLLPPSDAKEPEPGQLHAEVLWRFSAYRREDVSMIYYVATEKSILRFARMLEVAEASLSAAAAAAAAKPVAAVSGAASKKGGAEPPAKVLSVGQSEYSSIKANAALKMVASKEDFDIPWAVMDLGSDAHVYIGRKGGEMGNIQVKVVVLLKGDYEGEVVVTTASPIELRFILQRPDLPLNDSAYWSDVARQQDLWPSVFSALYVVDGFTNEFGDPDPREIRFRTEKTAADRVAGAIPTSTALQVAQDVLCALRVDSKCRVRFEGAPAGLLINEDDAEKTFLALKLDNEDSRTHVSQKSYHVQTVDNSHNPPTNIGSLQDKLERRRFEKAIREGKQSLDDADNASLAEESVNGGGSLASASHAHGHDHGVEESKNSSSLGGPGADDHNFLASVELNERLRTGYWDKVLDDRCSTLTMLATNNISNVAQVPGACEMGKMGLWFPHRMYREYTQAGANFFRDPKLSSTDTVLVNMSLALDTALIFPTVLAWEDFSQLPPKCVAEEADGVVPALLAPPDSLCKEPLISPIDLRSSHCASVFGAVPEEGLDHIPLDAPNKPVGMMRCWPLLGSKGFRRKVVNTLLGVDPVLPTVVFGITRYGAQPNVPGVNARNIWHNPLAITEHINRPRASKDYVYMIQNFTTQGANDPATFTTRMKAGECVGLSSSAFRTFEKEYEEIKLRRDIFARQLALDSKIESSTIALKARELALKAELQRELQRGLEKKLRKATKSEKGWSRRFFASALLEVQGNWERRQDEKTGQIFFRAISQNDRNANLKKEKFLETCQWEVPATWDGDPLFVPGDEYGEEDNISAGPASVASGVGSSITGGMFDQPPDSWHPALDKGNTNHLQASGGGGGGGGGKTPGSPSKLPLGSRVHDHQLPSFARKGAMNSSGSSVGAGGSLVGGKSVGFGNSSVMAEKSLAASEAATINTANLEHIAEQLVSSDELMRVLARRLGLSESQVVPAEDLSVFSVSVATEIPKRKNEDFSKGDEDLYAPRDLNEDIDDGMDSDDDMWSDDEQEVGNHDIDSIGELPQNHLDKNNIRKRNLRDGKAADSSVPGEIPFLNLHAITQAEEGHENGAGWRKLNRPDIPEKFFDKCTITQTIGPDKDSCNTFNAPVFLVPISPVDACQYIPENFAANIESIFIPDAKKDMERSMATVERNIKREEDLAANVATDDLLLFGAAQEHTTADAYVAKQFKQDQNAFIDPKEGAMRKAILAAKSNNIAEMEDALEVDISVNTADTFGNTLLILAAQQGSKRMCKFLLRRGANVNSQSLSGNTALHYCYAYSQFSLGEYLKKKGGDDTMLNIDKMTCYEGLSAEALKEEGDDSDEDNYEEGGEN